MTFSITSHDQPNADSFVVHDNTCDTSALCSCPKIEKVNYIKYLGVVMDKNLKWKDHIEYITNRLKNFIYKFYQLRNILPEKNLRVIYGALAESVIRYGILIWGGAYRESVRNLCTIQNTVLKILFRKSRLHSTEALYMETQTLNIRQLYAYQSLIWIQKNKTDDLLFREFKIC